MSTKNSKRKGNAGERELLGILQQAGLDAHRNDQRYVGGYENPDIALNVNGQRWHVECKRAERLNIHAAYQQAEHDAGADSLPVVMHRRNRESWFVTMKLDDLLAALNRP